MNIFKIQKKLEEQKEKARQERIKIIYDKVLKLLEEENVQIITFLETSPAAIVPRWTIVDKPKENEQNKTTGNLG